jgi:hypothetical protein
VTNSLVSSTSVIVAIVATDDAALKSVLIERIPVRSQLNVTRPRANEARIKWIVAN